MPDSSLRLRPGNLLNPDEIFRETILLKLRGLIPWRTFDNLNKCGREEVYQSCSDCGRFRTYYFHCDIKFCPICNWRIARKRAALLKAWTKTIQQPKHVVLTMKNFEVLTRSKIKKFKKGICQLRRSKFFNEVTGGCVSIEITNDTGKRSGWHLHAHLLVNVRWLDGPVLAVRWGKVIGQEFGIVKVKDCRAADYLGEVSKYVCKPAQLAGWPPETIQQFVHAIRGVRFFSTFGNLFNHTEEINLEIQKLKPPLKACACGCLKFEFSSEHSELMKATRTH